MKHSTFRNAVPFAPLVLTIALLLGGCSSDKPEIKNEMSPTAVRTADAVEGTDLIRNPETADTPLDPENGAAIQFEETEHDFGQIKIGDKVTHKFKFKSTGKTALIISNTDASCGCTVPSWPRTPIAPGETGEIEVSFNSANKTAGQTTKRVTVSANTFPSQTVLYIKGNLVE